MREKLTIKRGSSTDSFDGQFDHQFASCLSHPPLILSLNFYFLVSLAFLFYFFSCVWSTVPSHLLDAAVILSTDFSIEVTDDFLFLMILFSLLICCRHSGARDCSSSLWSTSVWPLRSYTSVCNTVATCCWSGATITAITFHHPSLQLTTHFLVFHSLSQCPVLNLVIISKSSVNSADPLLQKTILTSVLQRMCTNAEDRDRLFADLVWFCPFL